MDIERKSKRVGRSTRREFLAASTLAAATIGAAGAKGPGPKRKAGALMNTQARISSICYQGHSRHTVEDNRSHMLELVDIALRDRPDLICVPETFTAVGVPQPLTKSAEPLDGPTVQAFAKKARENRCYLLCPIMTREGERIYNSVVILDRSGEVAGVYHKHCPVTTSPDYTVIEDGVTPGDSIPVFDLDFGRVGVQICFDAGFPDNWQRLADQGARAVIWPSAYGGGFPLRAYAYLHHFWVISSTRSDKSRIIDPCGQVLKETDSSSPVISRPVNLDYVVAHLDFNYAIEDRIKAKYGDRVDVRMWDPESGHFVVEPKDPKITTKQICAELGLEPAALYHNRHREAYREIKKTGKAKPQKALHGGRAQYGK